MISAVMLAAGRGRRFGGDKLLHPLADGAPLIEHSLRPLLQAGVDVLVVTRPDHLQLHHLLTQLNVAFTLCPNADEGMGASLAHGVGQRPDASGWLVALADMPFLRAHTICLLTAALAEQAIRIPLVDGQRGHPVLFGRYYLPWLNQLQGDVGARHLLERFHENVIEQDVSDPGIRQDIDHWADLPPHR